MCKVLTYRTDCKNHGFKEDIYFETDQCREFQRTGEVCKITMFGEYDMKSCVHCRAQEQGGYYPTKKPEPPKKLKVRFDLDEELNWSVFESGPNKLKKPQPPVKESTKKEKVDRSDWMG